MKGVCDAALGSNPDWTEHLCLINLSAACLGAITA